MMEENNQKTRLLEDIDKVRLRITELEASEIQHSQAEKELREAVERYRRAVDMAPLGILTVDVQGRVKFVNSLLQKKISLESGEEVKNVEVRKYPALVESGLAAKIQNCLETQKQSVHEGVLQGKNGKSTWLRSHFTPIFNKDASISGVLMIMEDRTDQTRKESDLNQKLELQKNIQTILSQLVGVFDVDEAIDKTLRELGSLSGSSHVSVFLFSEDNSLMHSSQEWCASGVKPLINNFQNLAVERFPWWMEKLHKGEVFQVVDTSAGTKNGGDENKFIADMGIKSYMLSPVLSKDRLKGFIMYSSLSEAKKWGKNDSILLATVSEVIGDYTAKKRLEDTSKARSKRFQRLAAASLESLFLVHMGQIIDTNHAAGTLFGYKPSEYQGKDFISLVDEKDKDKVQEHLNSDTAKSIEVEVKKKDGAKVQVELLVKNLVYDEKSLKTVALRDISDRQLMKSKEMDMLLKLKETVEGTVESMASAVALHDPFCAGHEKQVAYLASAIAEELKLSEEQIIGIRVAALVHDIGKIGIPSGILSKPGLLTEAERMVVQAHPQSAYEILKDVKFPWPVANVVLQHHERLDGSGYPAGFSGKDILLEARILAVADKVAAMLCDRSYRSAKGLDETIEEITKNKESLYDSKVVDAALKLMSSKEFSLKV